MASEICVAVHQTVLKIYAGYGLQLGNTTCGFQFLDMQERCFVLLVTPDYLRKTEYVHELIIGSIWFSYELYKIVVTEKTPVS